MGSTEICEACERSGPGVRKDLFGPGVALCGPCRTLRSIGDLVSSDSLGEDDRLLMWTHLRGVEDNFKRFESARREENQQAERVLQGNRTPDPVTTKSKAPSPAISNSWQSQGVERTEAAAPKKQSQEEDYSYTEESSEEEIATVDHSLEDSFARSIPPTEGRGKPPPPPAPRRKSGTEAVVPAFTGIERGKRIGGGQKRKIWLQSKIEERRAAKAAKRANEPRSACSIQT